MKNKIILIFFFFVILILIGRELNYFVMNSNDKKMPVKNAYTDSKEHIMFSDNSEVKYWLLSDIFKFNVTRNTTYSNSIGDFFIFTGIIGGISTFLFAFFKTRKTQSL